MSRHCASVPPDGPRVTTRPPASATAAAVVKVRLRATGPPQVWVKVKLTVPS